MNWHGPEFVIALVAISTIGWLLNNWIRARHGYAPSNDWGTVDAAGKLDDSRKVQSLTAENEQLHGTVGRLEERIAVLERIATDPAERLGREIDGLQARAR